MIFFRLIFLLPIVLACTHFSSGHQESIDPVLLKTMTAKITSAEKALDSLNYVQAESLFANFESEYPQGIFLNRSKIGHARALAGQGKNAEAVVLYSQVVDSSLLNRPELVALASYYASASYEAMGEDEKTLATLLDALKRQDQLPPEISKAELPARLAASYNRSSEFAEAKKYFRAAEQGIANLYLSSKDENQEAKARTYYWMGNISSNQISIENLQSQMDTFAMMQIFLMRSVEMNNKLWSAKALENIETNYRDIWNAIEQIPRNKAMDAFAAEQEQHEAQFRSIGKVLDLVQHLKTFRRPIEHEENKYEKDLFSFLDSIESNGQKLLANLESAMPLTPEAQNKKTLRLKGQLVDPKVKNEPEPEPVFTDPNLQDNK